MPLIEELVKDKEKSKKFEKKQYRPWDDDIMGSSTAPEIKSEGHALKNNDKVLKTKPIETQKLLSLPDNLDKINRGLYGTKKITLSFLVQNIFLEDDIYVYTKPHSFNEVSEILKTPTASLKTAVKKLKEINLIEPFEYKPGRGGYFSFKIKIEVYRYFINALGLT